MYAVLTFGTILWSEIPLNKAMVAQCAPREFLATWKEFQKETLKLLTFVYIRNIINTIHREEIRY